MDLVITTLFLLRRFIVWEIAAAFVMLVLVNGALLVFSPTRWLRLPRLLRLAPKRAVGKILGLIYFSVGVAMLYWLLKVLPFVIVGVIGMPYRFHPN